ncbi:hypothetical protein L228DRAFT_269520 [Xylona heveae TC161]|uniref:Arrestin C-terminal-like domain-containing protein n=1 Tax=Xylona heveae (strain CBS 132557 / TC161) TaxID=1328760 RepID=A0A165FLK0_XYLHT|nr:hypothetical protein L228DRAFT_269520 [Xylona heveae TC161]KZF21120.1 hypothetical protein L228DRAFT_269520 [Xylona heveae TC161]
MPFGPSMAPNSFFGHNANVVKFFEIRLDSRIIVLSGSPHEASSALLKGTVVLCVSEPFHVKNIHLRLTGTSRVAWAAKIDANSSSTRYVKQESVFYKHEWMLLDPGKRKTENLSPGNYEYPFEVIIPGDTPQSIEGLHDSFVIYRMKATVERGMLAQNLHARRHMRIVRTLDPSALELAHAMSVENIWPNKIEYSISIPSKAVVFGTSVNVDLDLVPLLKGLKIGKIQLAITETQELNTDDDRTRKNVREVSFVETEIPEDTETTDIDGQEGYHVHRTVPLPPSLRDCMQDVECRGIKIRHKLRFNVLLHNPDGHVSELRGFLPVMIFISPNLTLDDNTNSLVDGQLDPEAAREIHQNAPPLYGEHQFDRLFSDIDPSGYMTPGDEGSGLNTPFHSQSRAHSRNASYENLASLNAVAQAPSAEAIQNRLYNLPEPGSSRWLRRNHQNNSGSTTPAYASEIDRRTHSPPPTGSYSHSPAASVPLSRRGSIDDHSPDRNGDNLELDLTSLSRVPSYTAAMRTSARTPLSEDLPDYVTATSRPPSPVSGTAHYSRANSHPGSPSSSGPSSPNILPFRPSLHHFTSSRGR